VLVQRASEQLERVEEEEEEEEEEVGSEKVERESEGGFTTSNGGFVWLPDCVCHTVCPCASVRSVCGPADEESSLQVLLSSESRQTGERILSLRCSHLISETIRRQ